MREHGRCAIRRCRAPRRRRRRSPGRSHRRRARVSSFSAMMWSSSALRVGRKACAPVRRISRARRSTDRRPRNSHVWKNGDQSMNSRRVASGKSSSARSAGELRLRNVLGAPFDRRAIRARLLERDEFLRAGRRAAARRRVLLVAILRAKRRAVRSADQSCSPPARRGWRRARGRRAASNAGAIFTAVCALLVVAPPMSSGSFNPVRSISRATCDHLVERRRDQAAQADDIDAFVRARSPGFSRTAPSRRGR